MKKVLISAFAASMAAVAFTGESHAALNACPSSFTTDGTANVHSGTAAKLTAASSCEYISPSDPSTVADETTVNGAGFFGTTTWEENQARVELNPAALSGTWSIDSVDFTTFDYMITFKDGSDTNLISFLFNELFSSGGWDSPFENPPFTEINNTKEVSHWTIFRRRSDTPGGGGELPVPGTLALLGFGLMGLGMAARRRKL